jgi:biopolymer transport protein ExbB/TolQ
MFALPGAVLATWGFYLLLHVAVRQGPVYDFFCQRGKYQHGSMFFFFYGIGLLLVRWWAFRRERGGSTDVKFGNGTIDQQTALSILEEIPAGHRDNLLGRRISNLIQGFRRHEDLGPLEDRLAENDRKSLDESAALIGWVRGMPPVLGLLGTLAGLRGGIAEIASISGGSNIEKIRGGLESFAANSSTAFDTTLLGIVAALVLSALLFFLRQREDRYLAEVDSAAMDLARRFEHMTSEEERVRRLADRTIESILEHMDAMLLARAGSFEAAMSKITTDVAGSAAKVIGEFLESVDSALMTRAGTFEAALARVAETTAGSIQRQLAEQMHQATNGWITAWRESLQRATAEILARMAVERDRVAEHHGRVEEEFRDGLQALERKLVNVEAEVARPRQLRIHVSDHPELDKGHGG